MADTKRLAFSIIQFLHDQLNSGELSSDAQESLEVAIQCMETAFEVSTKDHSLAVPQSLPEIFASATSKHTSAPQVKINLDNQCPTEEDVVEAEQLKSEGNDQMKVENFDAAVELYSKAIAINPQNAVYYCNRAAAYSKLGNYAGAIQDCEMAIGIDPNYSKAHGRMALALASLNKHTEAVGYYKKALELDPENETYKSNLKIAEQKMKEIPSPTAGMGGVDLAGLLSNPGFMNMASSLMNNPQVQQLMSGMMSGAYGATSSPPAATATTATTATTAAAAAAAPAPGGAGGPNDLSGLIQAGQQFAQQMQQQNPELIEQLRSQIRSRTPSASNEEQH
ncbi:small glutamine-rich tetratricopeptide repeat-containing protein alpha [Denticeps clupeoides]|uniref:Small glutamine-rich tetratricopeptide repeat-containing protein alpha n=1 Tax=Denticeps clupeoides TaxID=299321 RepID=A0AAY4EU10_9TELE|nr:small glutamine-rich tetratricopeptide repeat-containing protein alpha [Denticeps clupeoides]XP_028855563.1 small glutamine-rich tetratricopeptide repeat-containing protein alpha [Denticeps clupeoides]